MKLMDYIIIILLVVSGFFSWQGYIKNPNQADTVQVSAFPTEIAGWTSTDIPLTEKEYEILETRNLFVRTYTSADKSKQVMLYIIYSQSNRRVSHPPEMCFAGSGLALISNEPTKLDDLIFNRMHWEKRGVNQLVYHWYKAGDDYIASYWEQQKSVAIKSLLRKNASIAMIRLSTPFLKDGNIPEADKNLQEFTQLILPLLPKYIP